MAFRDELEATVAEIRRTALDHYGRYLDATAPHITLEDRSRVSSYSLSPEVLADVQADFDQYRADVDELLLRFERYYPLNATDLVGVRSKLCGTDTTAIGEGWSGGVGFDQRWPHKVVDRIDYAGALVSQMSEPADLRAEGIWGGPAADAFNDHFLVPFRVFAARQVFCGIYLANVAQIFRNVTRSTQEDVKQIAAACLLAFSGAETSLPSEELADTSMAFNLVGFVLPPPLDDLAGGTSLALGELAENAAGNEDPPEWRITAWYPWDIITEAYALFSTLEERLASRDDTVSADLDKDVGDYFYSMEFETRPDAPHAPDRVDDTLVVTIQTVYEYGARYLPAAANQYDAAFSRLQECVIPEWFGELVMPRSKSQFALARYALESALYQSSDHLSAAGQAIVTICNDYVWTDNAVAGEQFAAFKESLPPPQPADYPGGGPRPPRNVF